MKKISIIVIFLSICFLALFIVLLFDNYKEEVKITTIKKAYSYVSDYQTEEQINVLLYTNCKESYLVEEDSIASCFLEDEETKDTIAIKLVGIDSLDGSQSINNEEYFRYVYKFVVDFKIESPFFFESVNTSLIMNYKQNKEVKIDIGSMSFYKVPYFNSDDISISKLKGIVNIVNGKKTLVGIELGLRSLIEEEIIITKISPFDINIASSLIDVKKMNGETYSSSESISTLLGYNYNITSKPELDSFSLSLKEKENSSFLIPFKMVGEFNVSKIGFSVEYTINDEAKTLYFDDFVFFTESYNVDLNNPHIYVYENS